MFPVTEGSEAMPVLKGDYPRAIFFKKDRLAMGCANNNTAC